MMASRAHLHRRFMRRLTDRVPELPTAVRKAKKKGNPHRHKKLYSSGQWARMRKVMLSSNPLCAHCGRLAHEVDHIEPHRGDYKAFFSWDNLQALCRGCHKAKTRAGR